MSKNQQIWLALVAIAALWLLWQKKKNPLGITNQANPRNQIQTTGPVGDGDVFNAVISEQGPQISQEF